MELKLGDGYTASWLGSQSMQPYNTFSFIASIKIKLEDTLMKQKYTITVADVEMNVISEESAEAVEALVGIVDRKIREICEASRR